MVTFIIAIMLILGIIIGIVIYFTPSQTPWKQEYLHKVYPLAKEKLTDSYFDNLEFYYTNILPPEVVEKWSATSYKAALPGPSCQQLPCPCKDGFPDVRFDPDPLWKDQWPMCTGNNPSCCKSVQDFDNCLKDISLNQLPTNFDLWDAPNVPNAKYPKIIYKSPKLDQLWKPTLHPPFTAVVSKYPPNNWNKFYNIEGDGHNSWVEVVHAFFPGESGGDIGTWFYRAKGSGMFLNLGHTISSKNKIDFLVKMWGITEVARILEERASEDTVSDLNDVIYFWRGNGSIVKLGDFFNQIKDQIQVSPSRKYERLVEIIIDPFKEKDMDPDLVYEICRIPNTGNIDSLLIDGLSKLSLTYRTLQFTAQPNLYPGWTTEILYRGDKKDKVISKANEIPKSQLKVIDPTALDTNSNADVSDSSQDCNFSDNFRYLYCDSIKAQDDYVNMVNPDNQGVRNWKGFQACLTR